MCQVNSRPMKVKWTIGYRVYENLGPSGVISFYRRHDLPPLNKVITAESDPFHAFATKRDVRAGLKRIIKTEHAFATSFSVSLIRIFKCQMMEDIEIGKWDMDKRIKTKTAKKIKILKEVTNEFKDILSPKQEAT